MRSFESSQMFSATNTSDKPPGGERALSAQIEEKDTNVEVAESDVEAKQTVSFAADETPAGELPKQFYLLTHPRSASNLLIQILNLEEQHHAVTGANKGGYYFQPFMWKLQELDILGKANDTWTAEQRSESRAAADKCYTNFARDLEKLQSDPEQSVMFVKEHAGYLRSPGTYTRSAHSSASQAENQPTAIAKHEIANTDPWILDDGVKSEGNGTMFSDGFLLRWMPTFLVRHPALAFPSFLRAIRELERAEEITPGFDYDALMDVDCNLALLRKLYNFFDANLSEEVKQYGGVDWPVVLTGDVVMTEPKTISRYASLVRLDAQKLRFQWDASPKEEAEKMNKRIARFLSTLIASTGIEKGKTSETIDIDEEVLKWREEFGESDAKMVESWARAAMPDYEFFEARRLRAEPMVVNGLRV